MKKKMLMMSKKFLNEINNFCPVCPQWTLTESDETKMFNNTKAKDFSDINFRSQFFICNKFWQDLQFSGAKFSSSATVQNYAIK